MNIATSNAVAQDAGHFDVLIVGAGISGIGSAVHLKNGCPDKTYVVLEGNESFGGTWFIHTYPGIRSDSDLYTFGYKFKPWTSAPIAKAEVILNYMREVIEENDLEQHIRYGHKVQRCSWSSEKKAWTVEVLRKEDGAVLLFTTNFLWMCQGYYRQDQGYTPEWPGMENYKGQIVHPQTWPEDLDYKNKNVLVIGSGATAATIVPAMANECAHITMLQRSPTYFHSGENRNEMADTLRALNVPEEWVHEITRRKILADQREITRLSFEQPEFLRQELINGAKAYLGEDFDVEKHFTPNYRPWQQRLAYIPDGDLFTGIREGKASVVTDEIDTFTETGVTLKSGQKIDADIVITATGFDLQVMGGIPFEVDDRPVDFSEKVMYRGMMFTDVPNMLWIFGYLRTSWTMRVDMIGEFAARLFHHMQAKGASVVMPQLRPEEHNMPRKPFIEEENFNSGYIKRSLHLMPKQGDRDPWLHKQDYYEEVEELPKVDFDHDGLTFV